MIPVVLLCAVRVDMAEEPRLPQMKMGTDITIAIGCYRGVIYRDIWVFGFRVS